MDGRKGTTRLARKQTHKGSRGPKQRRHDQPKKRARGDEQGEKKRRADRAYYRRHRKQLLAYAKARMEQSPEFQERRRAYRHDYRQQRYRRIAYAELKLLQDDPQKRFRMARPERGQKITLLTTELTDRDIVCLECGAILETLGQHLRVHALRPKEYRRHWGYNRSSPLCSARYSQRMSKIRKELKFVPPPERRFGAPGAPPLQLRTKALREEGWRLEAKEKLRARMKGRGRPDRWIVPDEEIARLALKEKSPQQIAGQVHLAQATVAVRLKRIGFPSFQAGPYRFRHGEVIATRHLRDTCEDFELKPLDLARRMRIISPNLRLRLKHRRDDLPLALEWARKLERVQRRLRQERPPPPASSKGGRPRELLGSEERCIRRQYPKLMQDQLRVRRWLDNFEGRIDRRTRKLLWGWLCEQRRLGEIQVLLFWPEFFLWLEKTFRRSYLQGESIARLGKPLTLEFLARSFHVSARTIERVIWPGPQAAR